VLAKLTHDVVSLRFLLFAMVGSIGLFASLHAVHRA
jgi:dolichol-phosphate mannosyltransferase